MNSVLLDVPTLGDFAASMVAGTQWMENCTAKLGREQAIRRSMYQQYLPWLDRFFPKEGLRQLTPDDVAHLESAWLEIGHPRGKLAALMTIGWREDRWKLSDFT